MTARTRTDFLALTISAGPGRRYHDPEVGADRYRYRVAIDSDATGARVYFTFHAAAIDCERGIDQLDRDGLLWAFRCFVEDAAAGEETFGEFCRDLGYDDDSISARRVWRACRDARAKFGRLWHDDREPAWVLDMLTKAGIE